MTATSMQPVRRVNRAEWIALWLLVISVCINYLDRGNLSVAGVAIQNEFKLNNTQLGWLLGAFFWTYTGFQMVAGWLIGRYNVVWVFSIGYFIWSSATLLIGVVPKFGPSHLWISLAGLFILRLMLGIGESVAYPSYSKLIAAGFPERYRGIANGLIDGGSKLGPAFAILLGGGILHTLGWRWLFILVGSISLLWLVPWIAVGRKIKTGGSASEMPDHHGVAPGFLEILRKRDAWGTFLGLFCGNYAWYFMLTWLPQYFIKARKYDEVMMSKFVPLPFFAVAIGALLGGWLADRWIRAGATPNRVRKTFVGGGMTLFAIIFLPAGLAHDTNTALTLMIAAAFCYGFYSANNWALTQTLAGTAAAAGKWTGMQNTCGNVAGIVVAPVTGFILDKTGRFDLAFASVCALVLIGAMSFVMIVRRVEPATWLPR